MTQQALPPYTSPPALSVPAMQALQALLAVTRALAEPFELHDAA